MDFAKAVFKISRCIDSAATEDHHIAINTMINTVWEYADKRKKWDKSIFGGLALLDWQNANKFLERFPKENLVDTKE